MKRLIKTVMILLMWYPVRWIVRFLSPTLLYRLGEMGGAILLRIAPARRAMIGDEYRRLLPLADDHQRDRWVRGAFLNYCISELEVLLYPALNPKRIERMVTFEGREHLDDALKAGKGVLLFQSHFGAFQMTMPAIGYSGYKMCQISASAAVWKEMSDSDVQRRSLDLKARCEHTLPVTHIDVRSSLRPVFRALTRNEIVGVTVDGGEGARVIAVDFLGRKAHFRQGGADLAISTGAVIVPAFVITERGLRHRVFLHPPIVPDDTLPEAQRGYRIIEQYVALLEQYVRKRPDHYGYTLGLRRMMAKLDRYPFFSDYDINK